jgi:hypothetical protein
MTWSNRRWWKRWGALWDCVGTMSAQPSAGFAALEHSRGRPRLRNGKERTDDGHGGTLPPITMIDEEWDIDNIDDMSRYMGLRIRS